MDKTISTEKMQAIFDSAPKNIKREDIVTELVNNGYTIEGLNDTQDTTQSTQTPQPTQQQAQVNTNNSFLSNLTGSSPVTQEQQQIVNMQGGSPNIASGALKGIGQTAVGIGELANKGVQASGFEGSKTLTPGTAENMSLHESLNPVNTQEQIGKGAEQIAEFFIPGSIGLKAGAKSNFLTKALVEGLGTGAVASAQTGDLKKGLETGLIAGGLSSAMGGVKSALNYFGVPERLYQTIYKNNAADAINQLKSTQWAKLKVEDPQQYATYVKEGLIKEGKDGEVKVVESIAKQALDNGYKGSMENMAGMAIQDQLKNEVKAREIVRGLTNNGKPPIINVPEKEFSSVLDNVAERYKGVGFGEIGQQATALSNKFKSGKIDAETALEARRLFDRLRIQSSFDTNAPLSVNQENFKFMADKLRGRLSEIPGMADVMKNYQFSIEALDALAKESVRSGNKNVLSLIDTTLIGNGSPVSIGAYIGKKTLLNPTVVTKTAQSIANPGKTSTTAQAIRGASVNKVNKEINP